MNDEVKWKCPWCGRIATLVRQSVCDCRQCDCGAIAIGAAEGDWDEVTDAAIAFFRVPTRPESLGFDALLREDILLAGVEMREGVRDPDRGHPWGWAYISYFGISTLAGFARFEHPKPVGKPALQSVAISCAV
jgi:hypothetical protein